MRDAHSEEQHLSLQRGVHHVGLCDRAALTKPCGNTHEAADGCEDGGRGTDGRAEAQPELQAEREPTKDNCPHALLRFGGADSCKKGVGGRGRCRWIREPLTSSVGRIVVLTHSPM